MDLALLLAALLGHGLFWIAVVNRLHGTGVPRGVQSAGTVVCAAVMGAILVAYGWWYVDHFSGDLARVPWRELPPSMWPYLGLCWIAAVTGIARWIGRGLASRPPDVLRFHRTRVVELAPKRDARAAPDAPQGEEHEHHFLVRLPRNEMLHLDLSERAIDVPRLPAALDGLSIVHLSDFHFTGLVGKTYFREVVRHSNQLEPDLVAITGDLVDRNECIDWVPDTLGRLCARYGVFYILGNHDVRIDTGRLRDAMHDAGLIDVGGRWLEIEVRGERVILAGNELPWLFPAADMTRCPRRTTSGGPLRIVLSHSPDQLDWAQANDADLLLAGHTHGGQIRLPFIGAILTPSLTGVRYASGLFYAPPTIMHVTRGVSGELPVRMNCPPEMARLVLHAPREPSSS
jgi:predicted MPP superfamily phosphohydrolase